MLRKRLSQLLHWILPTRSASRAARRRSQGYGRQGYESLEARSLLTTFTWTGGGGDSNWSTGANWDQAGATPQANDDLIFSGNTNTQTLNDLGSHFAVNSIQFNDSDFDIGGDSVDVANGVTTTFSTGTVSITTDLFITANSTIDVAGGGTLILAHVDDFGSDYSLTKVGDGTLSLTGDNVLGSVTVDAGILNVSDSGALGNDEAVINNGATLVLSGSVSINNDITLNGLAAIDQDKLQITSGNSTLSGALAVNQNATFRVASGATLTISTLLEGSGGLTKSGAGVLTVHSDVTATLTGAIEVAAGELVVDGDLSSTTVIDVAEGARLSGHGSTSGVTIHDGAFLSPGNSPGILETGNLSLGNGATYDVEINGDTVGTQYDQTDVTGTVNVSGATLNLTLDYVPAINTEFVIIKNDGSESITGTFVGLDEGDTLTLGNVTFRITYAGGSNENDVVLTVVDVTYVWDGGGADSLWSTAENWLGDIGPTAGSRLIFSGEADRLSNVNDLDPQTLFYQISIEGSGYFISGNSIQVSHGFVATYTSSSSELSMDIELIEDVEVDVAAGGDLRFSGGVLGTGGVTKLGEGRLRYLGVHDNDYTGATLVAAGTLHLAKSGIANGVSGDLVIGDGTGTDLVMVENDLQFISINVTLNGEGAQLDLGDYSASITNLAMTGGTISMQDGELTLQGNVTTYAADSAAVIGGKLNLTGTSTFTVARGTVMGFDLDVTATVADLGGITKAGLGLMRLWGTNTYDGTTSVNAGALLVNNASGLGSTVAGTTVASGASLGLMGGITVSEALSLNGTGYLSSGALVNSAEANVWSGSITLADNSTITSDGGSLTISGVISNVTPFGLTLSGTAPITLSGTNTYAGGTNVSTSVTVTNGSALGSGTVMIQTLGKLVLSGDITVANAITNMGFGASLVADNGDSTISGSVTIGLPSSIQVNTDASLTLSGSVLAAIAIVSKTGAGTLTLSGTMTALGMSISAGSLIVDGTLGSTTPVFVNSGVLGGSGAVTLVNVMGLGTLAPGSSPGQFSTASITLTTGSVYRVELNGTTPDTEYDQTTVIGNVSLGDATLEVSVGFTPTVGDTFTIIDNDGVDEVSGTFAGLDEGATVSAGGRFFKISYVGGTGNDVVLTSFSPTPDIGGTWFIDGSSTRAYVLQSGTSLTLTNEFGQSVTGTITSETTLIASWDGGLTGTISEDRIDWSNDTSWVRMPVLTVPTLARSWEFFGMRTSIQQYGAELILTNEFGGVSRARFISETEFEASDWNNTIGTLSNGNEQINWSDGHVWTLPAPVLDSPANVSGAWLINGQWTQIRQYGRNLTLVNEFGAISAGVLSNDNLTITAIDWQLTGTIDGNDILWSNATTWTRTTFAPPALSHNWSMAGGLVTQLDPNGGELLLTNEFGMTSRAVFLSATEIYAVDWKVFGTLSLSNSLITWSNGTSWTSLPSDVDSLFADDFNPFVS